ncbi:MAG TPA: tetratricopeptide repeat protein, partial [Anaeromyxobacteraceae bacterium]
QARRTREALEAARAAAELAPPEALELRAQIEVGLGRLDAARLTLARWARLDARSPRPLLWQARLAAQADSDPRSARALLDRALGLAGDDFLRARLLSERAAAEAAAGALEAAGRSVAEALQRVPGSAPARFQESALAWRRGDARALREAAGVLGDRAGPALARLLQARLLVVERRYDEAVEAYRAIAAAAGPDLESLIEATGALARLPARRMALDLAAEAARRDPVEPRQRLRLREFWEAPLDLAEGADALADLARHELGRTDEALGAFRRALAANPGLPTARLGEALLLGRAGDRAGARTWLKALLRDDPGQARARGALLDLRP